MKLTDFASNKNKNILLNITVILITFFIVMRIYKTQGRAIQLLEKAKETEKKKNEILNNINESEKILQSYKNRLSKTKDISSILDTVSNIANESDVKIILIRPNREEEYPMYVKYSFNLTISAKSYHAIGRFISKLESHSDIYLVDKIDIRSLAGGYVSDETDILSTDLILSTVTFKG